MNRFEQETMSLGEALAASKPSSPIQQAARFKDGIQSLSLSYDGTFWDILYGGSPFGFDALADVEGFLKQEGIDIQTGWQPEVAAA
jgi:hypothetical protein